MHREIAGYSGAKWEERGEVEDLGSLPSAARRRIVRIKKDQRRERRRIRGEIPLNCSSPLGSRVGGE